jgi:hypothetical protein
MQALFEILRLAAERCIDSQSISVFQRWSYANLQLTSCRKLGLDLQVVTTTLTPRCSILACTPARADSPFTASALSNECSAIERKTNVVLRRMRGERCIVSLLCCATTYSGFILRRICGAGRNICLLFNCNPSQKNYIKESI